MAVTVVITFLYWLFFNALLHRFSAFQFIAYKPWVTLFLFNVKFVAGLAVWAIYTFYYTDVQNNDIHKFYSDALILHQLGNDHPASFANLLFGKADEFAAESISQLKSWYRNFDSAPVNENQTIIRFLAITMFISGQVYFVHILFMCFLSLIGFKWLVDSVFDEYPDSALIMLPLLFLPSLLFWMSGVLKEPLLIFSVGMLVQAVVRFKPGLMPIIKLVLACFMILYIKFYVLVCMVPACIAFLWARTTDRKAVKYTAVYSIIVALLFTLSLALPQYSPVKILAEKQKHSIREAIFYNAGSRMNIPEISDFGDVMTAVPHGLLNVFTRPLPTEARNVMMLMSASENLLILSFSILCVFFWRREHIQEWNTVLFLLACCAGYFALIGISTPVAGNLVRYKAALLPLFLTAMALMAKLPEKLHSLFSKLFLRKM